jgi:hypothetical protein
MDAACFVFIIAGICVIRVIRGLKIMGQDRGRPANILLNGNGQDVVA